jgi:hypothetical protein
VEAVDASVAKLWETAKQHGYVMLLTSDHGNAEEMWDPQPMGPIRLTRRIRSIALLSERSIGKMRDGRLADIAPTILEPDGTAPTCGDDQLLDSMSHCGAACACIAALVIGFAAPPTHSPPRSAAPVFPVSFRRITTRLRT